MAKSELTIEMVAGTRNLSDDRAAISAGIYHPRAGNLYVADGGHDRPHAYFGNHRGRKVAAATGRISTVVGTGRWEFSGDGGPAPQATLYQPKGFAVNRAGNVYIADAVQLPRPSRPNSGRTDQRAV